MPKPTETPRAELHTHLGGAVHPSILLSVAHRQGLRLPSKDYCDFEAMVTMKPESRNRDLDEMHNRVYHWTEFIQSSPRPLPSRSPASLGADIVSAPWFSRNCGSILCSATGRGNATWTTLSWLP